MPLQVMRFEAKRLAKDTVAFRIFHGETEDPNPEAFAKGQGGELAGEIRLPTPLAREFHSILNRGLSVARYTEHIRPVLLASLRLSELLEGEREGTQEGTISFDSALRNAAARLHGAYRHAFPKGESGGDGADVEPTGKLENLSEAGPGHAVEGVVPFGPPRDDDLNPRGRDGD